MSASTHPLRVAGRLLTGIPVVLAVVAAAGSSALAAPVSFGSGHLDWGVKESFRSYIVGPIGGGSYEASAGASRNPDGTIRFGVFGGTYDPATGSGEVQANGTVRFLGHGGTLDITITSPRVAISGGVGTLFVDAWSKRMSDGHMVEYADNGVVSLTFPSSGPSDVAGGLAFGPAASILTEAGQPIFSNYPAGTEFDPLALTALFGAARELPPDPSPSPGPDTVAPAWSVAKKALTVGRPPRAVAKLQCGSARCVVRAPKSVKITIKRKRYRVKVLAPKTVKAGGRAKLRIKLPGRTRRALAGRRTVVKIKVTIVADGSKMRKTIKATLKVKPARRTDG